MTRIDDDHRLPAQPRTEALTSEQVAEAAGVPIDEARRLWRALGFPDAGGEAAFTAEDREALGLVVRLLEQGGLDTETVVRLTRALGRTMSRLAEWQVSALAGHVHRETAEQTVVPALERLLVYAWRRHLESVSGRLPGLGTDEDVLVATQTVGFADLVGFTALSNGLDDDGLATLVERFESGCADVVTAGGGRVVKTLGDSVLFVADEPVRGTEIALDVVASIGADRSLPDVRVGLATGPVVLRMGDVYGAAVNMASRLTSVARRNRVICDTGTARLFPDGAYDTRALPVRSIRGFGDVEPIAVRRTSAS